MLKDTQIVVEGRTFEALLGNPFVWKGNEYQPAKGKFPKDLATLTALTKEGYFKEVSTANSTTSPVSPVVTEVSEKAVKSDKK
jgi:hypothetical protein